MTVDDLRHARPAKTIGIDSDSNLRIAISTYNRSERGAKIVER
jgi:hypothetical protein